MNCRALIAAAVGALFLSGMCGPDVSAQMTYHPTPAPLVTADNEAWYLEAEPITYSGSLFYKAGPKVYFNRHEMVRSGDYRGVPIFVRPTIDSFSVVYIPLAGGLMQAYERRREGELAGTTGTRAPSFPVQTASEGYRIPVTAGVAEAAGPPTFVGTPPAVAAAEPAPAPVVPPAATVGGAGTLAEPVGTMGPLASAQRPQGLNGIFIEYDGRRWFSSGAAVEFDASRFTETGEYRGFTVYTARGDGSGTIYVAVSEQARGLLAPYSLRQ
jgi:hypothetical protein